MSTQQQLQPLRERAAQLYAAAKQKTQAEQERWVQVGTAECLRRRRCHGDCRPHRTAPALLTLPPRVLMYRPHRARSRR